MKTYKVIYDIIGKYEITINADNESEAIEQSSKELCDDMLNEYNVTNFKYDINSINVLGGDSYD